ncbi:aspartyl-tRNA synthetase [Annulohypoxylon truncatum]|uniref:aspartyl-tRNA synthetase n=1 Tax=Annulohypoxylon truncatum TaxID=327061 RepID=UPI0020086875|nr:aspartyl-tRNA synthetase [Annulohypoxylon truncatum]KAI1206510.1 aspartyl-tRNA synthetase [Annulohypoxylon truncatum]
MAPSIRLKKPLLILNRIIGHTSAKNHITKVHLGDTEGLDSESDKKHLKAIYKKRAKKESQQEERKSLQAKKREEEERALSTEPPEIRSNYGTIDAELLPPSFLLEHLSADHIGQTISFNARLHHVRSVSSKLAFILLRQQVDTVQGVLQVREGAVSENFVRWAEHLNTECVVHVQGTVREPPEHIKTCSIHDLEIHIDSMHVLVQVEDPLAIDVYNMEQVEEKDESHETQLAVSNRVRSANRILFLRTPVMQSVFRIRSSICNIFRSTLDEQGFIEIQTPKLQPAATESGAEVFRVNYFGRNAFLAQSPQLAKQMAISSDFGRVFEIGPVFRAEDSNTHRHLTEYTGLDLEMAISKDYHEAMDVIDELLKSIFKGVYARCRKEIDNVKTKFPHEDLVWLEQTPRLTFKEGVQLLNSSGWTDDDGRPAAEDEDLGTRSEIRLGQLVKEKYGTDYFILDKFPTSARPFYTHLDPNDDTVTNSFDIFLRGQEITTGGQRINNPRLLAERMKKAGVDPDGMEEYMQAFEWGAPPHAGCGIGLERVLFLLLNLGDVRNATLFPRDPKSLPAKKPGSDKLPFPEADTVRYAFEGEHDHVHLPDLEKLIVNYGDATNTSWLDERYKVWRDTETGAAVGYAEENKYAMIMGNPLCDPRQYGIVISSFLKYLKKHEDLRPIWILASAQVEEILGAKLGWRTLTCVAEERVDVGNANRVVKKERQAKNAEVKIHETALGQPVPDDVRAKCDKRIEDWKEGRKGRKQVHITEVRPWVAMAHRRYLWAEDKNGEIVGLVILHRLSPEHGYQIKFALDFPGSPSGSIEALISRAIQSLTASGINSVTFGAGAMDELLIGSNLNGIKARLLSRTYKTVAQQLKLIAKSEFREKFGVKHDPVYICYPFMGLGVSGARTLIKFFEDEM